MKRVAILLLIIVFIALIGVGCYLAFKDNGVPIEKPGNSGDKPEILSASDKIIISITPTHTETQRRLVDVNIPAFSNLSDYSFQESINTKIADSINPYIKEINIVADETVSKQYKYTVSFERYNNEEYISIVLLQNYSTGEGGMRSNTWKDTYTIDVINNKEISLADICSAENYKKIIVAEVNKQAKEQNLNLVAGNGLADIPDTQRFYIKDKKLYIYFEPASIAPYLDGEMIFEMPFEFVNGKFIL